MVHSQSVLRHIRFSYHKKTRLLLVSAHLTVPTLTQTLLSHPSQTGNLEWNITNNQDQGHVCD